MMKKFLSWLYDRAKVSIGFIFLVLFLINLFVVYTLFSEYTALALFAIVMLSFVIGAALALVVYLLARMFSKKLSGIKLWTWFSFSLIWLSVTLVVTPVFVALIYNAVNEDASLPRVVLSNGEKELIFRGVQHIGSEDFYENIVYDMTTAANDGAVFLHEGLDFTDVSEADSEKFQALTGVNKNITDSYQTKSDICRLVYQGSILDPYIKRERGLFPENHVLADANVTDLIQAFDLEFPKNPQWAKFVPEAYGGSYRDTKSEEEKEDYKKIDDFVKNAMGYYERLDNEQKDVIAELCQAIKTLGIHQSSDNPVEDFLVLDTRNQIFIETLNSVDAKKVYSVYGALHFQGIYKLLREQNPKWEIKQVTWSRPYERVFTSEGRLSAFK